jgi:hypothetical protein
MAPVLTSTLQTSTSTAASLGNDVNQLNDANGEHIGIALAKISKIIPVAVEQTCLCSFQRRIHPKCEELKSKLDAWLQWHRLSEHGLVGYEKLLDSDVHLLVSMVYPCAKDERLLALVKQMVWLIMIDNYVDDPAHLGADAKTSEELVERLMGVFRARSIN